MPRAGFPTKLIVVPAILGMTLIGLGSRWGIGLTTDSLAYLQMADEIGEGRLVSTSTWPPLYPALLALVGGGVHEYSAARFLQILLAGVNIAFLGAMFFRLTRGSHFFTATGSGLAALSLVILETHTAAWSEPAFLLLLFAACLTLARFLDSPNLRWGTVSLCALSLIPLTRYVGVIFLLGGWCIIIFSSRLRLVYRLAYCLLSALPLGALLLWNRIQLGSSTGGGGFDPVWPSGEIWAGISVVAAWLVPGIDRYQVVPHQALLAVTIFILWIAFLSYSFYRFTEVRRDNLGRIVTVFTCLYPAFLLTTIGLSRHDVPVDQRLLCPVHFFFMVLSFAFLARYGREHPRFTHTAAAGWLVVYLIPALYGTHFLYKNGRGYLGPNYQAPKIYKFLMDTEPVVIRTNDRDAARVWLNLRTDQMGGDKSSPLLFYRVEHPLPPNHKAGFKRDLVPQEYLDQLIRETPMELVFKEGKVELYLPVISSF